MASDTQEELKMNITQQPLKNSPSDFRPAHKGYVGKSKIFAGEFLGKLPLSDAVQERLIQHGRYALKRHQIPVGSA